MPTHAQRAWLAEHRVYDSENPIPPTNAAPAPLGFFEAIAKLDDRQAPATRADVDALREDVRELRLDLALRQSALILGVEARREYGRIMLEQVLRRGRGG